MSDPDNGLEKMDRELKGVITRGHGNSFIVFTEGRYISCQLRGKVKFATRKTSPVVVGDDVIVSLIGEKEGVIERVEPRRTVLSRPAIGRDDLEHVLAANIDSLVIVVSIKEPPLKTGLIDRFLIAARIGGLLPAIVLNKMDLRLDETQTQIINHYRKLEYRLFLTSATESAAEGNEIETFRRYLGEHRSLLAGHSGVGKTALLNALMPELELPTAEISAATNRGRHTTSRMELFHLASGGFVIDSPGMKVLGLWEVNKESLWEYYPEMHQYQDQCRFTGCTHTHEPGCRVREAAENGEIPSFRYRNYNQIYNSLST